MIGNSLYNMGSNKNIYFQAIHNSYGKPSTKHLSWFFRSPTSFRIINYNVVFLLLIFIIFFYKQPYHGHLSFENVLNCMETLSTHIPIQEKVKG